MIRTLGLALIVLTAAAEARAETALPAYPPVARGPMLSLAPTAPPKAVAPIDLRYAQAPAVLPRGVARTAVCHPVAVSLVKVTWASRLPAASQSEPMWVPVLPAPL